MVAIWQVIIFMLENKISIDRKYEQNDFKVSIPNLRDVEQRILNYMLFSNTNFVKIKNKLTEDDLTFLIHKIIYKYLLNMQEVFLSENFYALSSLESRLELFSKIVSEEENVKMTSILDILSQAPSIYIDRDLEVINANSMEKEIAVHSNQVKRNVTIETKQGFIWADYINDRLISVGTTNIACLPRELEDNFVDTMSSLSYLNFEDGSNEASMILYGDPANPDGIESLYLKKDVLELQWFDNICAWADENYLEEDIFPRDREKLEELFELDISKKGISELPKEIGKLSNLRVLIVDNNNIKTFPKELYQLDKLFALSFINNGISHISQEVMKLEELLLFYACHNDIVTLPENFFKLKKLTTLCLHGNKVTTLSNGIGNLSTLTYIAISNNDISALPPSILTLENLEEIELENTNISNIPVEILQLPKLKSMSINDDLLALIVNNIQYIDIDTINLTASNINESSPMIEALDLNFDRESWVEDKDKKENGCIKLFKYKQKGEV
jgi:Leucine-rich repeat (LRR) protein